MDGFTNERNIARYLNDKTLNDLNNNWKNNFTRYFQNVGNDLRIKCDVANSNRKEDLFLYINDKKYLISVKTGYSNSIHEEYVEDFLDFLGTLGISENTRKIIKFFHNGQVNKLEKITNLGELKFRFFYYFKKANKELQNDKVIKAIIDRCLTQGIMNYRPKIDFLYYGTEKYGMLVSRDELETLIPHISCDYIDSIHFGPFVYQPVRRTSKGYDDLKMNKMKLMWPSLIRDIYYIDSFRKKEK